MRCSIERHKIMSEVEDLPEDFRQAVMLDYYDDLTYRDLAQLLGVSTATINARLTKARAIYANGSRIAGVSNDSR